MKPAPECGNCFFWRPDLVEGQPSVRGTCQRYPPVLVLDESTEGEGEWSSLRQTSYQTQPRWPFTAPNEWCGEFKNRLGPQPPETL